MFGRKHKLDAQVARAEQRTLQTERDGLLAENEELEKQIRVLEAMLAQSRDLNGARDKENVRLHAALLASMHAFDAVNNVATALRGELEKYDTALTITLKHAVDHTVPSFFEVQS